MNAAGRRELEVRWLSAIAEVDCDRWNRLACALKTPALEWEWLRQMEVSNSIGARTGWLPRHLTIWDGERLVAAAPLYVKSHSEGEFVFDQAWAEVAVRIGAPYYPKLVGMSPVTPVSGYRFLIDPGREEGPLTVRMVTAIAEFCRNHGLSGCSFLFVDPDWRRRLEGSGFGTWVHPGFVWTNPGYGGFEDYLAVFRTNQRRNIRRERRSLASQGITLRAYRGDEIPPEFLPLMYRYYARTNDRFGPWGCKYLTPEFFSGLASGYRRRLLVMAAFETAEPDSPLGMSLLLTKGDRLYGRYWGSRRDVSNLHFNLCYYEPIRWAIANHIRYYDPGIGGAHKPRRGFRAVETYSLHRFFDPRLRHVWDLSIAGVNDAESEHIAQINRRLPLARRS